MISYPLSIGNKVCTEASNKPDNTVLNPEKQCQYSDTNRMANYVEGLLPSACQGLRYHSILHLTLHYLWFSSYYGYCDTLISVSASFENSTWAELTESSSHPVSSSTGFLSVLLWFRQSAANSAKIRLSKWKHRLLIGLSVSLHNCNIYYACVHVWDIEGRRGPFSSLV